ncbi:hypothetical protein A2U01_0093856, partial [Trifolium medium]|nr:hypothetical protein [Trifolium medium]
ACAEPILSGLHVPDTVDGHVPCPSQRRASSSRPELRLAQ